LIEMLSYLSTELHAAFKPLWHDATEAEKVKAREAVARRLDFLESRLPDLYLFGPRFTVADAYLFVMLRWAKGFGVPFPPRLPGYFDRVLERSAVRQALAEEAPTRGAADKPGSGPVMTVISS
jgi:glutathione S-transferase